MALATLTADANDRDDSWLEAVTFARERIAEHGADILMAQTHLLMQALGTLRDVVNSLPDDVVVEGIETPATTLALLAQFGEDAARYED